MATHHTHDRNSKSPNVQRKRPVLVIVRLWRLEGASPPIAADQEFVFLAFRDLLSCGEIYYHSSVADFQGRSPYFCSKNYVLRFDIPISYPYLRVVQVGYSLSNICENKLSNLLIQRYTERRILSIIDMLGHHIDYFLIQCKLRPTIFITLTYHPPKIPNTLHAVNLSLPIIKTNKSLRNIRVIDHPSQLNLTQSFFQLSSQFKINHTLHRL